MLTRTFLAESGNDRVDHAAGLKFTIPYAFTTAAVVERVVMLLDIGIRFESPVRSQAYGTTA